MVSNEEFLSNIGFVCRTFRTRTLKMKLKDISDISGYSVSALGVFERGKSNSLKVLRAYLLACRTPEETNDFTMAIQRILVLCKYDRE